MASEDRRNSPDRTIAFEGRYPLVAAFGACYVDKAKQSLCQNHDLEKESHGKFRYITGTMTSNTPMAASYSVSTYHLTRTGTL